MYLSEASLLGPLEVNPLLVIGETYMALYVSKKERNVCKERQVRMRIRPIFAKVQTITFILSSSTTSGAPLGSTGIFTVDLDTAGENDPVM